MKKKEDFNCKFAIRRKGLVICSIHSKLCNKVSVEDCEFTLRMYGG